ncbi:unnamed protein product [Echinostoma caproni]|uniref:Sm domain-containing protein n=1 Tax=Echinostoma caproni TaxID=27848 RepID=A0A183B504_9TREM|nr:unnamed protein product [Echinostoma caproni]
MSEKPLFSSKIEAKEFLMRLCDQEIVVHVTDGRKYIGRFWCTDRSANLVLGTCIEYPASADAVYEKLERNLTAVVIPGQHITKIECSRSLLSSAAL